MADIAKSLRQIGGEPIAGGGTFQGTRTYSPPLKPKPPVGAKPPVVGKGSASGKSGGGGTNLTELSYATREYWPERTIYSSDGSISMRVRPVKAVVLANGQRLEFKEPV